MAGEETDEDEDEDDDRITLSEAMTLAKNASHSDATLQRQFGTLKKWRKKRKSLSKTMSAVRTELNHGYNEIDNLTDTYASRLTARFERTNKDKLDQMKTCEEELKGITKNINASKKRIASKFRYRCHSRITVARLVNELRTDHNEDE